MNKYIAVWLVLAATIVSGCASSPSLSGPHICIAQECVQIEVADTLESRRQGLMHRTQLADDAGMLFVFEQSDEYAFWMKNTLIPLDMIWIDAGYTIVDIQTAQPCTSDPCPRYRPAGDSLYVLEVNAGLAQQHSRERGESVTIKLGEDE